eukprot:gene17050-24612_t
MHLCLTLGVFVVTAAGDPVLEAAVTSITNEAAHKFNITYTTAVVSDAYAYTAAAGVFDRTQPPSATNNLTTAALFPAGSVTKAWTATRLMQLWEQGHIDLDEPAHVRVDAFLAAQNPAVPSLKELWGGSTDVIDTVTLRQLVSMQGGLRDYNSQQLEEWTLENPAQDYLPD